MNNTIEAVKARTVADGDCWLWTAGLSHDGYARCKVNGRDRYAHVVAWELINGQVPDGLELDHTCRHRSCCNPEHCEAVTHRENMLRGATIVAANAVATHCKHGHEFTHENTYRRPDGDRDCRQCKQEAMVRYKQRQQAVKP